VCWAVVVGVDEHQYRSWSTQAECGQSNGTLELSGPDQSASWHADRPMDLDEYGGDDDLCEASHQNRDRIDLTLALDDTRN
jgi:hypothetical protein